MTPTAVMPSGWYIYYVAVHFFQHMLTDVPCSLAAKLKNTPSELPRPPVFSDKHEERIYLKERLALAFRIFGYLGYDGTPRIWSKRC